MAFPKLIAAPLRARSVGQNAKAHSVQLKRENDCKPHSTDVKQKAGIFEDLFIPQMKLLWNNCCSAAMPVTQLKPSRRMTLVRKRVGATGHR
jgi:hypothetical protein